MSNMIEVYLETPQGERLVGNFEGDDNMSLQTIGSSIYQYIKDQRLVNYGSYMIKFSRFYMNDVPTVPIGLTFNPLALYINQASIKMLLPNDLYVDDYINLTISDLNIMLRGRIHSGLIFSENIPIKVYIGVKFQQGLAEYI